MFEEAENAIANLQTDVTEIDERLNAIDAKLDDMLLRLSALENEEPPVEDPDDPPVEDPDEPPVISTKPLINGDTSAWNLVFEDNFEGTELDQSKWSMSYWWDWKQIGSVNEGTGELQWYTLGDNIELRDGKAYLIARKEQVEGERDGRSVLFNYSSAIITTGKPRRGVAEKFPFQYGFVELRSRIPKGQGLWPAFWMLPVDEASRPEIDIFEFLGHETTIDRLHYHYTISRGRQMDVGQHYPADDNGAVDYADDFHVFGLDWTSTYLRWYVDGVMAWEIKANVPQEKMYVLINLAVGGEYPGSPDSTTPFPAEFVLDYVKIWNRV